MTFNEWLDTLIKEKGIDAECEIIEVEGNSGLNFIEFPVLIEALKVASNKEQAKIKDTLVKIDFANGDIMHFFRHLAKAIAV